MAAATPVHERAAGRKALASKGLALPDGGFPVPNAAYWEKARQAIGRVKNPSRRAAVAKLLRKTAPRFGKTQALKNSWAAPGGNAGSQANMYPSVIDLDWATWDAEHGSTAGAKAHATASATARRTAQATARRKAAGKAGKAGYTVKQDAPGSHSVYDKDGKRVGGIDSFGGVHRALRAGTRKPPTSHGSLDDAVNALTTADMRAKAAKYYRTPPYGLAWEGGMYELAGSEFEGTTMTCPACGHSGSASSFGASGASLDKSPEELRTPAPSTGAVRSGVPLTPGRGSVSAPGLAGSGGRDIRLARRQVAGPADLIISRDQGTGQAVIRHRAGGTEVARMRRGDDGSWVASVAGRDLPGRTHQRTALLEAVATYNRTAVTPYRPAMPLQGEPAQTPLMAEYGIPAIRMAGDGDGTDDDGLNPRGQAIKKKLLARGFPAARAVAFAHRAQNTRPGQFGQSGGGS